MGKIRVAIAGLGNCASFFIQAIEFYKLMGEEYSEGVITPIIGGYKVQDIEVVAAFDVNKEKVGKDISEAIFCRPNQVPKFVEMEKKGVKVAKGPLLDGVAPHMKEIFNPIEDGKLENVIEELRSSSAEVLINLLPVGSEEATKAYALASIEARTSFINAIPVFIASDPLGKWQRMFEEFKLPLLGDDIKGQIGATILHRTLTSLMRTRGVKILETYQLNVGGNTDFLNMKTENRLASKRISKTKAVTSTMDYGKLLEEEGKIRIGPSDYVPFLGNTKVAYIYLMGESFGGAKVRIEVQLEVDDKSNCSAILSEAVRIAKIALDRGEGGPIVKGSAYLFKHPPVQAVDDDQARKWYSEYINGG